MENKYIGTTIFTTVEVITLVVWLVLALSEDIIFNVLALLTLIGGFTLEHFIAYNVINNRGFFNFKGIPARQKLVVSLVETGIWAVWLVVALQVDHILAFVILAGLLIIEHTISDNVFRGKPLFGVIADKRTIGFSIIEGGGAGIWLVLVQTGDSTLSILGVVILIVGSFSEHLLSIRLAKRPEDIEKQNGQKI